MVEQNGTDILMLHFEGRYFIAHLIVKYANEIAERIVAQLYGSVLLQVKTFVVGGNGNGSLQVVERYPCGSVIIACKAMFGSVLLQLYDILVVERAFRYKGA